MALVLSGHACLAQFQQINAATGPQKIRVMVIQAFPDAIVGAVEEAHASAIGGARYGGGGGYVSTDWVMTDKQIYIEGIKGAAEGQEIEGNATKVGTISPPTCAGRILEKWVSEESQPQPVNAPAPARVLTQEEREKVKSLRDQVKNTPEVQEALQAYKNAKTSEERKTASANLKRTFANAMVTADPSAAALIEKIQP